MSDIPTETPPGENDAVAQAIDTAKPIVGNLTFGTVFGYCSGKAFKTLGQVASVVVGAAFISLQVAASFGYVQIDWKKVQSDVVTKVDATGDGKITVDDAKAYWKKLKEVLTYRLPAAGGFSLGFLYGLK